MSPNMWEMEYVSNRKQEKKKQKILACRKIIENVLKELDKPCAIKNTYHCFHFQRMFELKGALTVAIEFYLSQEDEKKELTD